MADRHARQHDHPEPERDRRHPGEQRQDGGAQPAGRPDQVGPARSVHDAVATNRGIDLRARPIHLASVTYRDDIYPPRLVSPRTSIRLKPFFPLWPPNTAERPSEHEEPG